MKLLNPARTDTGRKIVLTLYCLGGLFVLSGAQPPRKIREFPVDDVVSASLDRLGDLYVVSAKGTVKKYDTDGNFMGEFTDPLIPITLLEPWNPLRVFLYSKEKQQVLFLDRVMTPLEKISIDPSLAVDPILASPASNGNFWLLDKADFSLKKIDSKSTQVLEEVSLKIPVERKPDFSFLREYQNQIFLIDRNSGLQILSVTGKPIRNFPVKDLKYVGFLEPEIYYLENGKIKFLDLYSEEQRELSVDPRALFVLLTDERMIVVGEKVVTFTEYKP